MKLERKTVKKMIEKSNQTKSANVKNFNGLRNQSRANNLVEKEKYQTEIKNLRLFVSSFNEYVSEIVKAYPSDRTRKAVAVSDALKDILSREETATYTAKEQVLEAFKIIESVVPKKDSKQTLYGEGENGFSMDEVLNPKGELDLMSLCKELGVTD